MSKPLWLDDYLEEKRKLSRDRTRILILFGVILIPTFILLDYFIFPDNFLDFLWLRLITTSFIFCLMIFITVFPKLSLEKINLLAFLASFSVGAMIAYMCGMLGGYTSSYYAGILLVMMAVGLVMPWSPTLTALNGFACYLAYAFLANTPENSWDSLLNNSYFLFSTAFMSTASTYFSNRSRYHEFRLRKELEHKNKELTSLDKAKNRFFANLTHEFRTPLVSLTTALQMIQEKLKPDHEFSVLLHSSYMALTEMLENINDLLAKVKAETATLEMHWAPINIIDFSQKVLTSFQPGAHQKGLILQFDNLIKTPTKTSPGSYIIFADQSKLRKVLNNLIGNAIKFTDQGQVALSLSLEREHLVFSVRDTGIGIPKEDLPTLFDAFTQASNNYFRDAKGTGLGLAIVKEFVQAHDGHIEVQSNPKQGTTFLVKLPLGKGHIQPEQINSNTASPLNEENNFPHSFKKSPWSPKQFHSSHPGRARILIVEDTPQVSQALSFVLKETYNLSFAIDGDEALDILEQEDIDLIISDIMMPKKDGFSLLKGLKQSPKHKNLPIILLTSKIDLASKIESFEYGADEYISKPFNNIEVRTRVRNLLERRRMQVEFIHAEKMMALGQLVAGISHEILNPISYAKNATENIPEFISAMEQGKLSPQETQKHLAGAVASVQDGIHRVCEIAAALKTFAGNRQENYQAHDIHEGIESTLKIIHVNLIKKIQLHRDFQLKEKVHCKLNQLNQVFLNLFINAAQALEKESPSQKKSNLWISTLRQGKNAKIVIRDDGPGIKSSLRDKIFNPFFTTKDVGEGSGLGLYISQQIVHEHGGQINMDSNAGEGTVFTILIPLEQKGGVQNEPTRFTHSHIDRGMAQIQYPHRR